MPNCCIGVDVIVGFPDENHDDFLETYNYLNELDLSYLHVFTYSERENTLAAQMPHTVSVAQRAERSKMLHILSDKKRRAFYATQINTTAQVLFEADQKDGFMSGFTPNYVKVKIAYDPLLINELKKVTLKGILPDGEMNATETTELLVH